MQTSYKPSCYNIAGTWCQFCSAPAALSHSFLLEVVMQHCLPLDCSSHCCSQLQEWASRDSFGLFSRFLRLCFFKIGFSGTLIWGLENYLSGIDLFYWRLCFVVLILLCWQVFLYWQFVAVHMGFCCIFGQFNRLFSALEGQNKTVI